MAGTNDLFQTYLAWNSGSGLAQQADPTNGGNKLSNGIVDAYAQAGEVMPDNIRSAVTELNKLTDSEANMAGATPNDRVYLRGANYDPLAVRKRAQELSTYLYDNSAHARNYSAQLQNETAKARIQAQDIENNYNMQTLPDRVATVGIQRKTAELTLAQQENQSQQATEQQSVLDYVNKNSVSTDDMKAALVDGSANAMMATFGSTNRLAASGILNQLLVADNTVTKTMLDQQANQTALMKNELLNKGLSAEDGMKMLAGDLPIPEGYTRQSVQLATQEAASSAVAQHNLVQAGVQGFKDQAELESTYLQAMTTPMLQSVVQQLNPPAQTRNGPQPPRPMDGEGFVTMAMPDGSPVKIKAEAIAQEYDRREQQARLSAGSQIAESTQFDIFARNAQEATRQMNLAIAMSGVQLPQSSIDAVSSATQQAANMYRDSFAIKDDKQRLAQQNLANTVMDNAKKQVIDELAKGGAPQYLLDDMRAGRITSEQSFRMALRDGLGFGGASAGGAAGLGAVVDAWSKSANAGWFGGGVKTDNLRNLVQTDKDGKYNVAIEDAGLDLGTLSNMITQYGTGVVARGALSRIQGDSRLRAMLPPEFATQINSMLDPNNRTFADLTPQEMIGRVADTMKLADVSAQKLHDAGAADYADYSPNMFLQSVQQAMSDPSILKAALAGPSGVPDRGAAAVLSLYNSKMGQGDAFGDKAPMYDDIVATTTGIITKQLGGALAGRAYDGIPNAVYAAASSAIYGNQWSHDKGSWPPLYTATSGVPRQGRSDLDSLAQAASAQLYLERLTTDPKPSGLMAWIGNWGGNADLWAKDNGYLIGTPEDIRTRMAQLAGVAPDQLLDWAKAKGN